MADYHVYSTLTCDQTYPVWAENTEAGGPNVMDAAVTIKGGANVARKAYDGVATPQGMRTDISQAQHDVLLQNDAFKKHEAAGYIVVVQSKEKIAKVVADMVAKDASAPYVADDYKKGGRANVETAKLGLKIDAPKVGNPDDAEEE